MNPRDLETSRSRLSSSSEPERYELRESGWSFDLGRRDFLSILGGGLLVLCLGQDDRPRSRARLSDEVRAGRGAAAGDSFLARSAPGCTSARMARSRPRPARWRSARTPGHRSRWPWPMN